MQTGTVPYIFRQATLQDESAIWGILKQAIQRRKEDGSSQWQDGYPNPEVVKTDIENGYGFVLANGHEIIGYSAVMINNEPAYAAIIGKWLTSGDFVVYHRVAVSGNYLGKGLARVMMHAIEDYALQNNIYSVRADTNFDNPGMLALFEKMGYTYCGEVFFRGGARRAYEKVLPVSS
ncbi:MAG: N-acetyltransferase family protein [Bacteroidia bacterium]